MAEIRRENMGTDDENFDDDDEVVNVEDQFSDEIIGTDVEDVEDIEDINIADNGDSEQIKRVSEVSSNSSSNSIAMFFAKRRWILWIIFCIIAAFLLGITIGTAVYGNAKKMKGHPPATFGNPEFGGSGQQQQHTSAEEPLWDPNAMQPGTHINDGNSEPIGNIPNNSPQTEEEAQYAKRKRHFTTLVVEWSGAAAVATPGSPARNALSWILDEDPFRLTTVDRTIDIQQRYIMAVFYFATLGDHWSSNRRERRKARGLQESQGNNHDDLHDTSVANHIIKQPKELDSVAYFLTYRDVCHWSTSDGKTGVFCDDNGALQKLEFRDFGLGGTLPRELGYLSSLDALNVEYNDIEGNIPTYFGLMMNLHTIKVENNLMTGRIPEELGNLKKLEKLDLDGNTFNGSLPTEIGGLERIVKIEIGGSVLTGSIPAEISNLRESLQKLDLRDNGLSGKIPIELGSLSILNYLDLENNKLTGAIPTELSAATSLEMLYLNGNDLAGSLDSAFCDSNIPFFEFVADCRGASPEVKCSCCTSCCNPEGSNCTSLISRLDGSSVSQEAKPAAKPVAPPVVPQSPTIPGVTEDIATVVSIEASTLKAILATVSDISLLETKHTDQYKAFMWMVNVDPSPVDVNYMRQSTIIQKYIMILIYISTNGKGWNDQSSYLTDASVCNWRGLTCNDDGEIVSIELEHNNLVGTLVSEIGSVGPSLRKLHLGMNFLQGALPSELGLLSGLRTFDVFDNNDITGTIPSELSIQSFPDIKTIELVGTGISGNLDPVFCTGDPDDDGTRNISANCFGPSVICSCCEVCCDAKGENCKVLGNDD